MCGTCNFNDFILTITDVNLKAAFTTHEIFFDYFTCVYSIQVNSCQVLGIAIFLIYSMKKNQKSIFLSKLLNSS